MRKLPVLLLSLALTAAAPAGFTPYLVKDLNLTPIPGNSYPSGFIALGKVALFQVSGFDQDELWRTDGTASGTYRLAETGYTRILAVTGNRCFFSAWADDNLWHLWVTDGTLPGTFALGATGLGGSYPHGLMTSTPAGSGS